MTDTRSVEDIQLDTARLAAANQQRHDEAIQFQGAMSVALPTIKRIAETGYRREVRGVAPMTPEQRLKAIADDCERLMAMLPADLLEGAERYA